jgi:3-deoxy-D-manno-octulosonic acid (KDO) 8-phosphate synthase
MSKCLSPLSDANQRAHTQINFNFASAQKKAERQSALRRPRGVGLACWVKFLASQTNEAHHQIYFSADAASAAARADVTGQITLPISI